MLAVSAPVVRLLDDRSGQLLKSGGLVRLHAVGLQPAGQTLGRSIVLRELVLGVQLLHVLRHNLGDVEGSSLHQVLLELCPVEGLVLFGGTGIPDPNNGIRDPVRRRRHSAGDEGGDVLRRQAQGEVLPLRRHSELAGDLPVDSVKVKAVLRPLVVEGELIDGTAIEGRCLAHKSLRLMDVPKTGEVHAHGVDGSRKHYDVLACQEGGAVVRLASADRVVSHQDGRLRLVQLRGQAQHDVVDKRRSVPVLRLLVHPGAEQAEAGLVEAGDRYDLDRSVAGGDLLNLRLRVDMQVLEVLGGSLDELEGPGVVVVHGAKQQHHGVAALAQRDDELLQGVVDVLQGGVRPDAGPVEQVSRDDGHIGFLQEGPVVDLPHTPDGVFPTKVLAVLGGTGQVPEVNVSGMQNLNH